MEEKKYLKWYNKIGYGSGDIAGNVVYAFLTSFMMVYLTDSVGLAAGVVGTLIAVSKLFDGFTDIFFGSMIDKTHSKMGKAKPWMLYGYIGCAITLVCCFAVPVSLGTTAKYAWFFISYTLLNGVFYTANNIAYSALTSLITKNSKERVQMGSYRFIFAFSTSLLIQAITVGFVDKCGGDAAAWRTVAIIYAIIGLVVNTISEGVDIIPTNIELSGMEISLVNAMSREQTLKLYLSDLKKDYDYILIDCMPSLGMLTINALAAADSVIVPVQAHYLPLKGMTQLMKTIGKVQRQLNPNLKIDGVLLTLADMRTKLAKTTEDSLRENYGRYIRIFKTIIPVAITAAESSAAGQSIYEYDKNGTVAKAYAEFTREVLKCGEKQRDKHESSLSR